MTMTALATARAAEAGQARDYRPATRAFHWATAVLVLCMVFSGVVMTQLGSGPTADILFNAHKLAGFSLLLLIAVRLAWRIGSGVRRRRAPSRRALRTHRLLYAGMFLVPLLGLAGISDFGARTALFDVTLPAIWPEGAGYSDWLLTAHACAAFGLLALVCVHVGVALHDYVTRGAVE